MTGPGKEFTAQRINPLGEHLVLDKVGGLPLSPGASCFGSG